jgi:hypothetical protein
MTISKEEIKADFERFIRHEAMRANCTQSEIREIIESKQEEQKHVAKYKVGDTIYYSSFGRLVSFVIANIVEDGTDNPMYEDKDGNSVFEKDLVEQKPAEWSANDLPEFESYLCLMFQKFRTKGVCTNGEIIDFVKEYSQKLKDTLCHAWNEEDEAKLKSVLFHIEDVENKDVIDWLKSLRHQKQWKPSENELEVLKLAAEKDGTCLMGLYEQLKKLMEE